MMEKNLLRGTLSHALPITTGNLYVRLCTRSDMTLLASWPQYRWPYDVFRFSFQSLSQPALEAFFKTRAQQRDRITLVCDHDSQLTIGYVAILQIDWHTRKAANMSIRVHPAWCDDGIGTTMLRCICEWWFHNGMKELRLDVAATNQRAIRCYSKVGFRRSGEFWREASSLRDVDITDSKYAFLNAHLRWCGQTPEIRFYTMTHDRSTEDFPQ